MPADFKTDTMFYTRSTPSGVVNADEITLSTRLVLQEAEKYGMTWQNMPGTKIILITWRDKTEAFRYQIPSATTDVGFYGCLDKSTTSSLLRGVGIRVPRFFDLRRTDSKSYWHEVFEALPKPLVVKPTHGNQGQCVTMNISDEATYEAAVEKAFGFLNDSQSGVMVEETVRGEEYRVITTREKAVAIIKRIPANVVGDGISTLAQLIEIKNSDPRRSDNPNDFLVRIKPDVYKIESDIVVTDYLTNRHLTIDSIPQKNQRILLRPNSNISTGGDSIDYTDLAHPSVRELAVRAHRAIPGLSFAGVDFMTTDITVPQTPENYAILEVNSSPGFSIHQFPYEGTPRNCAQEFLKIMFPDLPV